MELKIEMGEGCFGPFLQIDGEDYDDMSPERLYSLIEKLVVTQPIGNRCIILKELIFKLCEILQSDEDEEAYETDSCEQCGNFNWSSTKTLKSDD